MYFFVLKVNARATTFCRPFYQDGLFCNGSNRLERLRDGVKRALKRPDFIFYLNVFLVI